MARRYSSAEKARAIAALQEHNGNLTRAAKAVGMPRKSLDYLARSAGVRSKDRRGTADDVEAAKKEWAQARSLNLAEMRDPEKVKKASLLHNTISAGTAQDKLLILSGKPTQLMAVTWAAFLSGSGDAAALGDGNTLEGEVQEIK